MLDTSKERSDFARQELLLHYGVDSILLSVV